MCCVLLGFTNLEDMRLVKRVAKGLAYVPQGRMIFSTMTVKENIETGLVVSGGTEVPEDIYELFPVLLEMQAAELAAVEALA